MKLFHRLRSLFRKEKLDAEMAEEMRHHVELQTELNLKAGMSPDEARYAALRQFGNVAGIQEQARDVHRLVWMEQISQDVRYSVRQLMRSPGFTAVVVLTLALGIGATTAIFSAVNTIILHPVDGPEPERMVETGQRDIDLVFQHQERFLGVSPPVLEALLARRELFAELAWSDWSHLERKADGFVNTEFGAFVSPNFFVLLGAQPLLGRTFASGEELAVVDGLPINDTVIVLSYAWWQARFGGDPQVLGRVLEMGGRHFTIVGIMPAHFRFPDPNIQYWIPAKPISPPLPMIKFPSTKVFVRLNPGIRNQQAQAILDTMAQQLMSAYTDNRGYGGVWRINPQGLTLYSRTLSVSLQDGRDWPQLHHTLYGMLAAIGFVLLIVCANVANLALARVERRQHELAVRAAVGAGQGRLIRQLLTENLMLALVGGAAGLVVTAWGLKALVAMNQMPRLRPIEVNGFVLGVALAVSTVTGIAFGLAPIWRGARVRVNALLADGGMNATGGRQRSYFSKALVIGQVALTVVLLTGAGLMLQSVNQLLKVNPGFDPENLLLINVPLPWRKYSPSNMTEGTNTLKNAFCAQLHERLVALPGVKTVGFQETSVVQAFTIDGRADPITVQRVATGVGESDVFRAMRIPLLGGRYFSEKDAAQRSPVMINETMAVQCWPGENAIGKKFRQPGPNGETYEVIGVVGDLHSSSYTEVGLPTFYRPAQAGLSNARFIGGRGLQFVIRTDTPPEGLIPAVRRELKATEPDLGMPGFTVARQRLFDSTLAQRTYRNYLALFAGVGLSLSSLGIYGVLAYSVGRRTREIGIRMVIGAEARQVCAMIMEQGVWLIGVGLAMGLGAACGLTRFLQNQLFNVSPTDPLVMGVAVLVLFVVALVACWLPARRAAKVDPVIALRAE